MTHTAHSYPFEDSEASFSLDQTIEKAGKIF